MKNQTINLNSLCSCIGLFTLFLIFSGSELKAESFSPAEKKYFNSNKIKWVRYDESYKDKEIKTVEKDSDEPNNKFIKKVK